MLTPRKIARLFTDSEYADRMVRGRLYGFMRRRLHMAVPLVTEDRRVLEGIIFQHYRRDPGIRTVLFVGCESYTAHYQRRYFAAHDYWTIDPDQTRRQFGAKQHIVTRLEDLGRHFPGSFFNLIVCNGVYGWGLNAREDCERALSQCHACLADGGYLLFGWSDVPSRNPAPLDQVRNFEQFAPYAFPAFGASRFVTDTPLRHTYHFYQKR